MKFRILSAVIFSSVILCSNAQAQYVWISGYSGTNPNYQHKVLKFDYDGNLLKEINVIALATGNIISVDPRGYVWTVNAVSGEIFKLSFEGAVLCSNTLTAGSFVSYCGFGLALDTNYNPVVSGTSDSTAISFLERFDSNNCGSILYRELSGFDGEPGPIAIDRLDNIWATASVWVCAGPQGRDRIFKYSPSFDNMGTALDLGGWPGIYGLAIDANNNLVAVKDSTDNSGVRIRTIDQSLVEIASVVVGASTSSESGIVVDQDDMRYTEGTINGDKSFSRSSMTGDIIEQHPLPLFPYGDINIDFDENLWIVSWDGVANPDAGIFLLKTSKTGSVYKSVKATNFIIDLFFKLHSGDFTGYRFVHGTLGGVNTPVGTNVQVPQGGGSITFDTVSAEGLTSIAARAKGQGAPTGFRVGSPPQYYDITTTATFSGNVEVCLMYDEAYFSQPEASLRLFHRSGSWADITTSVDDVNNIICGVTTSFSQFAVAEPLPTDCGPGLACYGDGDGDLIVDITDVNMVRDASLLLNPDYSMVYPSNGDTQEVSGGGVVDVTDVNAIRDWALLRSNALALAARPSVITVINPPSSISAAAGQAVLVQVEVTNSSAVARSGVGVVFEVISGSAHIEDGEGDASLFPDPDNIGFNFPAGSRFSVTGAILKNGRAAANVIIDGPGPITIRARVPKTPQRDLPNSIFIDINLEGL